MLVNSLNSARPLYNQIFMEILLLTDSGLKDVRKINLTLILKYNIHVYLEELLHSQLEYSCKLTNP